MTPTHPKGYDPNRLRRAARLKAEPMGHQQFRITGNSDPVYVDLSQDPPCYCADQQYRGRGCKHELCARLHSGDATLIQGLGDMLFAQEKHAEKSR